MVATAAEPSSAGAQTVRRRLGPRLRDDLFSPRNSAGLAFFRIAFGTLVAWEVWRYFDPNHAWIGRYFVEPDLNFTYWPLQFVAPLPGAWMYAVFGLLGAAAVLVTAGLFYRVAATVQFVLLSYVFLIDKAQYLNHLYLICLLAFLLIFVPAHRAYSLDAALWSKTRNDMAPAWSYYLIRFQVAVPYVFAGLAKLNYDWLVRHEPVRQWLANRRGFPLIGSWLTSESIVIAVTYGSILAELAIVPLLLFRRTRLLGLALAVIFNLATAWLFSLGILPWVMIAATLIFMPTDWPRALIRDLADGHRIVTAGFVGGAAVGVVLGALVPEGLLVVAALVTGVAVGVIGAEIGRRIEDHKPSEARAASTPETRDVAGAELAATQTSRAPAAQEPPQNADKSSDPPTVRSAVVIEPIIGAHLLPMSEATRNRVKAARGRLRSRHRRRERRGDESEALELPSTQAETHHAYRVVKADAVSAPPSAPPPRKAPLPPPTVQTRRAAPRDPPRLSRLTQAGAPHSRNRALVITFLAIWVALQIAIPLRYLAVPGDVAWTEDGHRFAWRMQLREKDADIAFVVTDNESGETFIEDPLDHLTPLQANKLASRPDMIVAFSHELERRLAVDGRDDVRIRAHSFAGLNGRPRQPFISPDVDLTEVSIHGTLGKITVPLEPVSEGDH